MLFEEMAEQVSERIYDPVEAGISIYVGLEHLSADDLRIRSDQPATEVTYGTHGKLRLRPGQIVFGRRRTNLRKLGVSKIDAVCSEHSMILNERPTLVPGFLPFFMQSDIFMDRALEISEGSLSPTIKWATMAQQTFLVPPPEQQHDLVELMRGFDAAIEAATDVAVALEEVDEQLLKAELTPTSTWVSHRLADIAELRPGLQRSPARAAGARPVKYLRVANISDGHVDLSDVYQMDFTEAEQARYTLKEGDLLLVDGGDVGLCAVFETQNEAICHQNHVIRVRVPPEGILLPKFLFYVFRRMKREGIFAQMASGTTIKSLGSKNVSGILVATPDLPAQQAVLAKLEASEKALAEARQHVAHLRTLRAALLNTALSPAAAPPAPAALTLVPA